MILQTTMRSIVVALLNAIVLNIAYADETLDAAFQTMLNTWQSEANHVSASITPVSQGRDVKNKAYTDGCDYSYGMIGIKYRAKDAEVDVMKRFFQKNYGGLSLIGNAIDGTVKRVAGKITDINATGNHEAEKRFTEYADPALYKGLSSLPGDSPWYDTIPDSFRHAFTVFRFVRMFNELGDQNLDGGVYWALRLMHAHEESPNCNTAAAQAMDLHNNKVAANMLIRLYASRYLTLSPVRKTIVGLMVSPVYADADGNPILDGDGKVQYIVGHIDPNWHDLERAFIELLLQSRYTYIEIPESYSGQSREYYEATYFQNKGIIFIAPMDTPSETNWCKTGCILHAKFSMQFPTKTCESCHAAKPVDSNHATTEACDICHRTEGWKPDKKLKYGHSKPADATAVDPTNPTTCTNCHSYNRDNSAVTFKPTNHLNSVPNVSDTTSNDCGYCHGTIGWKKNVVMNHLETRRDCDSCHTLFGFKRPFSDTPAHVPVKDEDGWTTCNQCHYKAADMNANPINAVRSTEFIDQGTVTLNVGDYYEFSIDWTDTSSGLSAIPKTMPVADAEFRSCAMPEPFWFFKDECGGWLRLFDNSYVFDYQYLGNFQANKLVYWPQDDSPPKYEFYYFNKVSGWAPYKKTILVRYKPEVTLLSGLASISVDEGQNLSIPLLVRDKNEDGLTVTHTITGTKAIAGTSLSGSDFAASSSAEYNLYEINWTPDFTDSGNYTLTINVTDGYYTTTKTVSVVVNNVNLAPIASNDSFTILEDAGVQSRSLAGSDPDGQSITYSIVTSPTKGIVTITNTTTGAYTYTPSPNNSGIDTFTFRVSDGQLSADATVTVSITGVNDLPTITGTAAILINEGAAYNFAPKAYDNDLTWPSDPFYGPLTFSIANKPVWASFDTATGRLYGTPGSANGGTYSNIQITVNDSFGGTATLPVFSIFVNAKPTISGSPLLSVNENVAYSFTPTVSDNAESQPLTYSVTNKPVWAVFSTTTGTLSGTPNYSQAGTYANVTITVTDSYGVSASLAAFTILVNNVNRAPTASSGTLPVTEDVTATGTLSGTDLDVDAIKFSIVTPPTKGTVTITNTATGAFSYQPNLNVNGADSFTFKVTETASGLLSSNTATMSISITAVNDRPVGVDGLRFPTLEDTPVSGKLLGSDVDSTNLTFSIYSSGSLGTVVIAANGDFTFTPSKDASGVSGTFSYRVADGSLFSTWGYEVVIPITPVNDAPVANSGTLDIAAYNPKNGTLSATDVDSPSLTYAVSAAPTKGTVTITNAATGQFTYTPYLGVSGTDSFSFTASDGSLISNAANVNITFSVASTQANGLARVTTQGNGNIDNVATSHSDSNGATYFGGAFTGTVDLDFGPGTLSRVSGTYEDAYIVKIAADGTFDWAWNSSEYYAAKVYAIASDANGNVYAVGDFSGTSDFDPSEKTSSQTAYGSGVFVLKLNSAGQLQWVYPIENSGGNEYGRGIAVDASGDVYVSGYTDATALDYDSASSTSDLKYKVGYRDAFLVKIKSNGTYGWSRRAGGASVYMPVAGNGNGVATDANGGVYWLNAYGGTINANIEGPALSLVSNGSDDVFVSKYDVNGNRQWTWNAGGTYYDGAAQLASNGNGVYLLGYFNATVNFNPLGTAVTDVISWTSNYVVQLDSSGQLVKRIPMNPTNVQWVSGMAIDRSGNIYTTGRFTGTADLDSSVSTANFTSNGDNDAFITMWNYNGGYVWSRTWGGIGYDTGVSVSVDRYGEPMVAGLFSNTVDFDPNTGVVSRTVVGQQDVFTSRFSYDPTLFADSDNDTLADAIEVGLGLDPNNATDLIADFDNDGLNNLAEYKNVTNNRNADSDNDGIGDKFEIDSPILDPNFAGDAALDADRDGFTNYQEYVNNTNLQVANVDNYQFVKTIGNSSDNDVVNVTKSDALGNLYLGGRFTGTVDFDPNVGVASYTSGYYEDPYVVKLNADGSYAWTWYAAGYYGGQVRAVAIDAAGNVYATGYFSGTTDFDPSTAALNLYAGNWGTFIVKLNSQGAVQWAYAYSGDNHNYATGLALDSQGNAYMAGYTYASSLDYDPTAGTDSRTRKGYPDAFITRINSNGSYGWTYSLGTASKLVRAEKISIDSADNIYVTGAFTGTVNFNPTGTADTRTAVGSSENGFVMRLNTAGQYQWMWSSTEYKPYTGIRLPKNGENGVYLMSNFYGSVDFNPRGQSLILTAPAGSYVNAVIKLDANGFATTGKTYPTFPLGTMWSGFDFDGQGNLYVTGNYAASYDFDPTSVEDIQPHRGLWDVYITKYFADGFYGWTKSFGGGDYDLVNGISVATNGDILVDGHFNATVDFNPGSGIDNRTSAGYRDIYVLKLKGM